jgi:DNA-binding CsgD family transcriptional regulator
MLITVNDFFKPIDLKSNPSPNDYKLISPYIKSAEAFSRLTYQSVYIIDYYKRGFAYVSDNPLFLCGKTPKQVLSEGYYFYLENVPQKDLEMLLEINLAGFGFYAGIPTSERLKYTISYDFHIRQQNKHLLLINHKLTPFLLDRDSNIWMALCVASISPGNKVGNVIIKKAGEANFFEYDFGGKKWEERNIISLNAQEKEILLLSCQGLNMNEIAEKMYLTANTIKFHRKNVFKKLKVMNIAEAIARASTYKLL